MSFLIGYTTDGGYEVILTGRDADELTKTDGEWRSARRIFSPDR